MNQTWRLPPKVSIVQDIFTSTSPWLCCCLVLCDLRVVGALLLSGDTRKHDFGHYDFQDKDRGKQKWKNLSENASKTYFKHGFHILSNHHSCRPSNPTISVPQKVNMKLLYDPAILLQVYMPKN